MTDTPTRAFFRNPEQAFRPVLRRDPCAYCLRPDAGTIDHIRARRRRSRTYKHGGGANTVENLTGACDPCNRLKGDRPLLAFLARHRYPVQRNE